MKVQQLLTTLALIPQIAPIHAANKRLGSPNKAIDDEVAHLQQGKKSKQSPCLEWDDQEGAYEALSAKRKEDCVMKMVKSTEGQRAANLDDVAYVEFMDTLDLGLSFGPGDMLPYDMKAFHTVGFIAAVEFESVVDNLYTGKFS